MLVELSERNTELFTSLSLELGLWWATNILGWVELLTEMVVLCGAVRVMSRISMVLSNTSSPSLARRSCSVVPSVCSKYSLMVRPLKNSCSIFLFYSSMFFLHLMVTSKATAPSPSCASLISAPSQLSPRSELFPLSSLPSPPPHSPAWPAPFFGKNFQGLIIRFVTRDMLDQALIHREELKI